ncbi:hypothetical protein EVG20_g4301 [Dentipellis fragilis]|uniref:Uncharacterized protein n=1 Tax=Dentipellis fragilis TaxID=205917 RepID=A0A4Y9YW23_9AGAM|nr:hypothetical protein EVG20_g4301 [Dentipellis fragilis]
MPSPTAPSPDDEPRPKKPYVSPWIPVSLVSFQTHLSDVHNIRAPACHNLSGPGGPPSHAAPTPKRASTPGTLRRILDGSSAPPPRRATVRNPGAAGSSRVPRSAASSSSPSSHTLSSAPPPRRVNRSSTVAIPGFVSRAPTTPPTSPTKPSVANSSQNKATEADDSFNAPLYILKAFSIATGLVVAGGVTVVWGVKTYLGVRDVRPSPNPAALLPHPNNVSYNLALPSFFVCESSSLTAYQCLDGGVRCTHAIYAPNEHAVPRVSHPSTTFFGAPPSDLSILFPESLRCDIDLIFCFTRDVNIIFPGRPTDRYRAMVMVGGTGAAVEGI